MTRRRAVRGSTATCLSWWSHSSALEQAGFEHVLIMPQFGTLPADLTEKNLRLLGAEVVPALQALDDNNYAGFEPAVAAE